MDPWALNCVVGILLAPSSASCGFQALGKASASPITDGDVYCKYQVPSSNDLAMVGSVKMLVGAGNWDSNWPTMDRTLACCSGVADLPLFVPETDSRSCRVCERKMTRNGMHYETLSEQNEERVKEPRPTNAAGATRFDACRSSQSEYSSVRFTRPAIRTTSTLRSSLIVLPSPPWSEEKWFQRVTGIETPSSGPFGCSAQALRLKGKRFACCFVFPIQ